MKVPNDAGVFNARNGFYQGKSVTVTHRDPATDQVYLEDYPVQEGKSIVYGCWVNKSSIKFVD